MRNQAYFFFLVSAEQVNFARQLVSFSLDHHRIPNIWDGTRHQDRTADLRTTGSLGEILFADAYGLPRPFRAFGADDGQDLGRDFDLCVNGQHKCFDIKTMRRKTNHFRPDYVLNIPAAQLNRPDSLTDSYFHINLHQQADGQFVGTFVGFADKEEIRRGAIGQFHAAGATRIRADGSRFTFFTDTYEIDLGDLLTPPLTDRIRQLPGFGIGQMG
ncbi:MAG TPA: hypothetical protein PKL15_09350 [Saprospiraceae bacterium]|nr:hypothetical protein [Saprospiraceae bacterium]HNM25624.1 hypothetical protein [Saprospiraceae bacterium]